jgi:diguanylate cyclase (GGDEF)-like protein
MKIHVADAKALAKLLNRKKKHSEIGFEVDLGLVLREILTWAEKLVPSETGSILLDDPITKLKQGKEGRLYFSACFGRRSASLVGTSLADGAGIVAETYRSGRSHISKDVREDGKFFGKKDRKAGLKANSVICAPISIGGSVIGVIELINRKGKTNYDRRDLALLEIFAGYTATLIENALIGRSYEELSRTDDLTGLYNDRYFFSRLEYEVDRALRRGGDVALIFFDLDHFKDVNDAYGHLAGSTVLKEVGDILRSVFDGSGAVMARYGGDEYVIVLRETEIGDAMKYAEQIRDSILQNTFIKFGISGGAPLNIKGVITCSIGVASLLRNIPLGKSPRSMADALIKAADDAMYRAKEMGKNRVFAAREKRSKKARGSRKKTRDEMTVL